MLTNTPYLRFISSVSPCLCGQLLVFHQPARRSFLTIALGTMTVVLAVFIANAQEQKEKSPPTQPMSGMSDMQDQKMNERGDHVMGFDHTKTTHHFRLLADGGSIEVEANSPKDTESRDQIRMHLGHIAKMFTAGTFKAPMLDPRSSPSRRARHAKVEEQYRIQVRRNGTRCADSYLYQQSRRPARNSRLPAIPDQGTQDGRFVGR
jgi:hypothetical protein